MNLCAQTTRRTQARYFPTFAAFAFVCTATQLVPDSARATGFWETRLSGGLLESRATSQYELAVGFAFDTYLTSRFGVQLGMDGGVLHNLDSERIRTDLILSPEISVWRGEDIPRQRPYLTLRPIVLGLEALDGRGKTVYERSEIGVQYGLMLNDGSYRIRGGLFWAPMLPGFNRSFEPVAILLRLTIGFAPPARLPGVGQEPSCLPCQPCQPC